MYVKNNCSYPLLAYGWRRGVGNGDDQTIAPGAEVDVIGPMTSRGVRGAPTVFIGKIICHEGDDNCGAFNVATGNPLVQYDATQNNAICVRHHLDKRTVLEHPLQESSAPLEF